MLDHSVNDAKTLLYSMRLKLSNDEKDSFALILACHRDDVSKIPTHSAEKISKGEMLEKARQLQGTLCKAKRLYNEILSDRTILDDIPPCQVSSVSMGHIEFSRDEHDDRIVYDTTVDDKIAADLWPVQILDHLQEWAATVETGISTASPWNESTAIQSKLWVIARICRVNKIRISAAENSQFYRIAAFVFPHIADLRYRIKKVKNVERG